jgi:hypothetical protein
MQRIVASVTTLGQHLEALDTNPEVYRPQACPHCQLSGLWRHGCYHRKADRSAGGQTRNPIAVLRFLCRECLRTCSRLPLCIAPRRWYGWAVQQMVLALLLIGLLRVNQDEKRVVSRRNVTRRLVVVPARFLLLQWSKAVGMWAKVAAVGNAAPRSGALSTVAAGAPPWNRGLPTPQSPSAIFGLGRLNFLPLLVHIRHLQIANSE